MPGSLDPGSSCIFARLLRRQKKASNPKAVNTIKIPTTIPTIPATGRCEEVCFPEVSPGPPGVPEVDDDPVGELLPDGPLLPDVVGLALDYAHGMLDDGDVEDNVEPKDPYTPGNVGRGWEAKLGDITASFT